MVSCVVHISTVRVQKVQTAAAERRYALSAVVWPILKYTQYYTQFIGSASLYKAPFLSLQHVERRWANFDTAIRRGQGIHVFVWNKHLEILLHCWVIWKVAKLPPPPPPLGRLILATHLGVWRLNLAFPHLGSRQIWAPHRGGWLGLPSRGLSPKHKELVFCLVLLNYMTSGLFSWCYILLLTQRSCLLQLHCSWISRRDGLYEKRFLTAWLIYKDTKP